MILLLILIPFLAAAGAFYWRSDVGRRTLLIGVAVFHAALTAVLWATRPDPILGGWIGLDPTGLLFLSIVSVLFLASAVYGVGYLAQERRTRHDDVEGRRFFGNEPEAVFHGCMLLLLGSMTLVTASQNLGLLWVAVAATTLASAPLIDFHRHHRSREATWKYLLIGSVGIALALIGSFLLASAASRDGQEATGLVLSNLLGQGLHLHPNRLRAAFLFILVGYGTQMGLAPMHTWLPDVLSESPSVVSALLSGALLNCAFLGILRTHQVCLGADVGDFSAELLVVFGLLSMAIAAVFLLSQSDYKRMLAYSSVEHMGILALGVGLGGVGAFGAALHAVNHSLTRAALFLVAGNILAVYGTKSVRDVRGLTRVLPVSGVLWVAGFLSITGTPPFGLFLSEFTILKAALDQGRGGVAILYLALLALIFVGMTSNVLAMARGQPEGPVEPSRRREVLWAVVPPALLCLLVLVLGLYVPPSMSLALHDVARSLGGY